jgi:BON domain
MKTALILALLASSCSLFAGPPLTKSHSEGKFSDAEIEATIKAKLAKSKIGKDGLQVHVKDRVATWTGSTAIMQHKGAATRMAKSAGAMHVLNNIKVTGESPLAAKGNPPGQPRHVQVRDGNGSVKAADDAKAGTADEP